MSCLHEDQPVLAANNRAYFDLIFGMAIDINPLENPYVKGSFIQPSTASEYVDRSKDFPHKINEEDFCKVVFTSFGFRWGGNWRSVKDYQHFEK